QRGLGAKDRAALLATVVDLLALIGVPAAGSLQDFAGLAEIEDVSLVGNAAGEEHVEFRLLEGRGDLVLHDMGLDARADLHFAVLEVTDPSNVDAHAGIELEGATARRRLGIPEHDADL